MFHAAFTQGKEADGFKFDSPLAHILLGPHTMVGTISSKKSLDNQINAYRSDSLLARLSIFLQNLVPTLIKNI